MLRRITSKYYIGYMYLFDFYCYGINFSQVVYLSIKTNIKTQTLYTNFALYKYVFKNVTSYGVFSNFGAGTGLLKPPQFLVKEKKHC